ncbi:SsgA family sporulation/cell division regulator [Streptomyces chartreusis]|uniref:SsgA family sporulation/cell division regulator n=1 Tax=Streptomyces chartreusis TaxID=1969 RepID=UPI003643673C
MGPPIPVSARLSYYSWDPYGIHIAFYVEGNAPIRWVLGRDLLAEGTVRPSGFGDVRIWSGGIEQPEFLCLEFSSPEGSALFNAPVDVVTPWLGQTYNLVPAGFEGTFLDLEHELSRLLGEVT